MKANHDGERIQTTLGDLVVALSDAAFELYEDVSLLGVVKRSKKPQKR
jgi:hypothetical protein